MKNWIIRILLLAGFCVPYAFLAMNGDATFGTMMFYGIMVVCLWLLCWVSVRTENRPIIIIGNILSTFISYLFLTMFQTEMWQWYFKPFSPRSLLITISVIALVIQLIFAYSHKKARDR